MSFFAFKISLQICSGLGPKNLNYLIDKTHIKVSEKHECFCDRKDLKTILAQNKENKWV